MHPQGLQGMLMLKLNEPVFVMGCGHSGTTLMRDLIGNHSQIYKTPNDIRLFQTPEAERHNLIDKWNQECVRNNCHRWMDKMAAYIRIAGEILNWFQESKLVVVMRDGRDVALSLRKRSDFKTGVDRWLQENEAIKPFLHLPNVTTVKYEEVVKSPEATMKHVFQFIGEVYEEGIFDFWKVNRRTYQIDFEEGKRLNESQDQRNFEYLRLWQISQPLYDASGKWKAELSECEKDYFKKRANHLLVELGYATDDCW